MNKEATLTSVLLPFLPFLGQILILFLSLPSSKKPMESQVRLFSGTNTQYLASAIAESYGVPLGKVEVRRFSDGEMCPVILESIRGDYVF